MMGRWFQEEVAGDRYIFDSAKNPVVFGCPQGAPVFVIVGEEERAARQACDAHNAMVSDRDSYRHRAMEAEHLVSTLTAERDELRRRLDAVVAMLEPGSGQLGHVEDENTMSLTIAEWNLLEQAYARAVAIAEGRTE